MSHQDGCGSPHRYCSFVCGAVLGFVPALAALAPTDATAVSAIARGMPHRTTTILRAESLINDGASPTSWA